MFGIIGWMVAAFLAGVLLALFIRRRRPTLQQRVTELGVFAGRTYAEILLALDAPQEEMHRPDGQTLRTWHSRGYGISLLFDGQEMCLGVEEEN